MCALVYKTLLKLCDSFEAIHLDIQHFQMSNHCIRNASNRLPNRDGIRGDANWESNPKPSMYLLLIDSRRGRFIA